MSSFSGVKKVFLYMYNGQSRVDAPNLNCFKNACYRTCNICKNSCTIIYQTIFSHNALHVTFCMLNLLHQYFWPHAKQWISLEIMPRTYFSHFSSWKELASVLSLHVSDFETNIFT